MAYAYACSTTTANASNKSLVDILHVLPMLLFDPTFVSLVSELERELEKVCAFVQSGPPAHTAAAI